jgi:hypothetical protein
MRAVGKRWDGRLYWGEPSAGVRIFGVMPSSICAFNQGRDHAFVDIGSRANSKE